MEALIAISGLLAAVGVGAVGIGYARARGGASYSSGSGLTTSTTSQGTITRDSTGTATQASGVLKFALTDRNGKTVLVSTYSTDVTPAASRKVVAQDLVARNVSYLLENGIAAILGQADVALFTSSIVQPESVQTTVAANSSAAATAAGTNQANLDRELQDYLDDGFSLAEAEIVLGAGGEHDAAADLQAKVYPGWNGTYNGATDKIVRVPWAPLGAPASVGTPGGLEPTNYGLVVPR